MIYIIISNIGLAIMTIVVFVRYSHFRISSNIKIRDLEKSLKANNEEKTKLETSLRAELKKEIEQVKNLLRELEQSRKERHDEVRLRLEAEKQIEIAMQKIQEVKSRMSDWKAIQESTLRDSKEAVLALGNELLRKLTKSYKEEIDENRNKLDNKVQGLYQHLEKISKNIEIFKKKSQEFATNSDSQSSSSQENKVIQEMKNIVVDDVAKKSLSEVVSLIKASGLAANKDYILATDLDANRAKFMLCDLVLLRDKTVYFIDFKADRYFADYEKFEGDKESAKKLFIQKTDKYFSYISNPKYRATIEKLIANLRFEYSNLKIIFAVRNRDDLKFLKDLQYIEKAQKSAIDVLDVNGVNDLIL